LTRPVSGAFDLAACAAASILDVVNPIVVVVVVRGRSHLRFERENGAMVEIYLGSVFCFKILLICPCFLK
jgi:hypothetical protein